MSDGSAPLLRVRDLCVEVPGRTLVRDLAIDLLPGSLTAVLGCNGSGKTLTLLTLAGLREPAAGSVLLDGRPLADWTRRDIARRLALLPQDSDDVFPASVLDTALVGRHPHVDRFGWETAADIAAARAALAAVDIATLASRDVLTLSGGERRRVAIAQLLAQAPSVYLLDEPTNHLDPQHQLDTLRLFRRLADDGASVVASLHDVNLAARFADRCLLLHGDGRYESGATAAILDADRLGALYGTAIEVVPWRGRHLFVPGP